MLLLHQQHAGPEQIDKTVGLGFEAGQLFDRVLKGGHAYVGDAEDFEKINPERLALAVLIGRVRPSAAEGQRAGFDFVLGEGHGPAYFLITGMSASKWAQANKCSC